MIYPSTLNAEQALKELLDGNKRYTSGIYSNAHLSMQRRIEVVREQHPIAVVLGCSDSRVLPEIVFNQGIGDVFVVRTAGNVVDAIALGSIEYAIDHLHAPLIVVLGHQACGAVTAAVKGGEAPGHVADVIKAIQPALVSAKGRPGDAIDNAVRANVESVVEQLKQKLVLAESKVALKIVGAYYALESGSVTVIV